jgi:hypothetical protein
MDEPIRSTLATWADFYLITGSAAAALTGLQFVVQTLIASDEIRRVTARDTEGGVNAFSSPTVVHFTLALVVSAVVCAPWTDYGALRVTLGILGLAALGYSVVIFRRARSQRSYHPVAEDWIWHVILPFAAYGAMFVSALVLGHDGAWPLFALAAATLLLVCVGIHNAWDTVTYLTLRAAQKQDTAGGDTR